MERLIIVLIVVLAVIAISQLLRVYELGSRLKGNKEEDISLKDNKLNANLWLLFMVAFYAFFIWLYAEYGVNRFGKGLPASDVGESTDWLLGLNFVIITLVFFLTNTVLFVFAWKYYYREDRKALYFPHKNILELAWTVVPAMVLAVIIILGLRTWFDITDRDDSVDKTAERIEIFSEQFAWYVRYAGEDNQLGRSDYKLITASNPLGVVTTDMIAQSLAEMDTSVIKMESQLNREGDYLPDWKYDEIESKIIRTNRLNRRLASLAHQMKLDMTREKDPINWDARAGNDLIAKDTLFLVKGRKYDITLRAKDVIHSAYLPHFRQQMNTVPGATTFMSFTPTMTTAEKKKEMNDPNFEFVLVCNKICGGSHSNMVMMVYVGEEDEFRAWISRRNTVDGSSIPFVPFSKSSDVKTGSVTPLFPASVAMENTEPAAEPVSDPVTDETDEDITESNDSIQ